MQKSVSCCSECGTNPVESSKRRGSSNWRGFHSSRVRGRGRLRSASLYRFSAGVFEGRSHELHWPLCTADFVHVGQPSTLNKSRTVFHGVPRHSGQDSLQLPLWRMRLPMLPRVVVALFVFAQFGLSHNSPSVVELDPGKESNSGLLQEVLDPLGRISAQDSNAEYKPICRSTGQIQDACSDYESVEEWNARHIFHRLDKLRQTKYFRYFVVDLFRECPFWREDQLCINRACTVERMQDMPEEFRSYRLSQLERSAEDMDLDADKTQFCQLDDQDMTEDAIFVDLMKNPERFTGYAGASANRVWRSIYEENCFGGVKWTEPPRQNSGDTSRFPMQKQMLGTLKGVPATLLNPDHPPTKSGSLESLIDSVKSPVDPASTEQCLEKRVFYRVISGLHASISIHICNEFLDPDTKTWGPDLGCFITRISQHPERLQNVYFNYVLLMRALSKAGEYLEKFSMRKGDEIVDEESRRQLNELLQVARQGRPSFDEHKLFELNDDPLHNYETLALKEDFRLHFRNISRIMDCVGCDKCRLWGKVQVTGLGTALRLLFAFEATEDQPHIVLGRNELVALINTAHRISESIQAIETFRTMYQETAMPNSRKKTSSYASAVYDYVTRTWGAAFQALRTLVAGLAAEDL